MANSELGRKSIEEFHKTDKNQIIIVLDNVRSLNNVGSVFRTADSFLLKAVYLCGITAKPPHREIQKTALGATETVSWLHFDETLQAVQRLKQDNYRVIAIEQAEGSTSLDLFTPDIKCKYALIFGHEVKGVSQEILNLCDQCVEIPQFGTKHSLNIAVSVGVVVWDVVSKLNKNNN